MRASTKATRAGFFIARFYSPPYTSLRARRGGAGGDHVVRILGHTWMVHAHPCQANQGVLQRPRIDYDGLPRSTPQNDRAK
jgi:hypothetical protein